MLGIEAHLVVNPEKGTVVLVKLDGAMVKLDVCVVVERTRFRFARVF